MASKMLRRSGVAVGLVAECLGWRADWMVQVGVGQCHEEVDVLKAEWPGVQFVGFEPQPDIVRQLKGAYPGEVHPVALGEEEGWVELGNARVHKDGASLHPHRDQGGKYQRSTVYCKRLDAFKPPDGRVLLWLDCEGSELEVLRGGEHYLRSVAVVNLEATSRPPGEGWCSPEDVWDWMVGHKFFCEWVHTQRISAGQCDQVWVRPELFKPEFCCFPTEVRRWRTSREVAQV